jgi:Protein of unknown function (DUF4238)
MSKAKRQHFVPRMLLRHFATPEDGDRIWQLPVEGNGEPTRVGLNNAAVVHHYYTHFRDRPHKPDDWFWEDLLAEWEGKAAKALRALEEDPDHIRGPAQALIHLQLLRTPLGQAQIGEQAAAERRRVFAAADETVWARWWAERKREIPSLGEWLALREVAEAARAGRDHPLLAADATTILDEMMTVLVQSGFGERLLAGDWNILHADPDQFVIGDEPVTYAGQSEPARPVWSQSEIPARLTMPISRTRAIEVRREKRRHGLDARAIEEINLRAFEWATRFVYGPDPEWLSHCREVWRERGCGSPPPVEASRRRRR